MGRVPDRCAMRSPSCADRRTVSAVPVRLGAAPVLQLCHGVRVLGGCVTVPVPWLCRAVPILPTRAVRSVSWVAVRCGPCPTAASAPGGAVPQRPCPPCPRRVVPVPRSRASGPRPTRLCHVTSVLRSVPYSPSPLSHAVSVLHGGATSPCASAAVLPALSPAQLCHVVPVPLSCAVRSPSCVAVLYRARPTQPLGAVPVPCSCRAVLVRTVLYSP